MLIRLSWSTGQLSVRDGQGSSMETKRANRLEYSGGHTGTLKIFRKGKEVWSEVAFSGSVGKGEWEKDRGPIPGKRRYWVHNRIASPPVLKFLPNGDSVATPWGIQKVQKVQTDAEQDPRDTWGEQRLRIKGHVKVRDPTSDRDVQRGYFYIHGGSPNRESSAGCIKVPALDLKGFFKEFAKFPRNAKIPLYVD